MNEKSIRHEPRIDLNEKSIRNEPRIDLNEKSIRNEPRIDLNLSPDMHILPQQISHKNTSKNFLNTGYYHLNQLITLFYSLKFKLKYDASCKN